MKTDERCIAYVADAVANVAFVVLLIVDVVLKSIESPATSPTVLDWIVFVFVVGFVLQELSQMYDHKGTFRSYATDWNNLLDVFLVVDFVAYYCLLFVGYYVVDDNFSVIRASFHVLGFGILIFCGRFLSYLQLLERLGPVQLSFVAIFYDFVSFLIILVSFMIGFAVSLTSVYSAVVKSPDAPINATVPGSVAG